MKTQNTSYFLREDNTIMGKFVQGEYRRKMSDISLIQMQMKEDELQLLWSDLDIVKEAWWIFPNF